MWLGTLSQARRENKTQCLMETDVWAKSMEAPEILWKNQIRSQMGQEEGVIMSVETDGGCCVGAEGMSSQRICQKKSRSDWWAGRRAVFYSEVVARTTSEVWRNLMCRIWKGAGGEGPGHVARAESGGAEKGTPWKNLHATNLNVTCRW